MDARTRVWVIAAAAVGGLVGSRLLALIEDPSELAQGWRDPVFVLGNKTIVGGLIGGLGAVEWVKRQRGIDVATGDLLVMPLVLGIAIGRVGCFLSGLEDRTYGVMTSLWWAVNFGDGVARHPTQLYEIAFLAGLGAMLAVANDRLSVVGDQFKLFMLAYVTFRLFVDFIKPAATVGGLSAIQWACLAVMAYYTPHVRRLYTELKHG